MPRPAAPHSARFPVRVEAPAQRLPAPPATTHHAPLHRAPAHRPGAALAALLAAATLGLSAAPAAALTDAGAGQPRAPRKAPAAKAVRTSAPAAAGTTAAVRADYANRDDVRGFVREMSERHGFGEEDLLKAFSQVRYNDVIVKLMSPPAAGFKRSWAVYRTRFLDPLRIREGARFWRTHEDAVRRAADTYGVPEEIIVSIIGVETIYGRITGDFRVLDALSVLTFDYPRRAEYFRGELEQFLLHVRDQGLDPLTPRGSFAGAIGLPQFMPGSIRRYAVDFDGDGRIDLGASPVDAIGSVARFLSEHGWRRGEGTHYAVRFGPDADLKTLIADGIEPRRTLAELAPFGVGADADAPQDMRFALIDLPNGDAPTTYLLGGPNFYVITRYNRSSFYAMAVIELAQALKSAK